MSATYYDESEFNGNVTFHRRVKFFGGTEGLETDKIFKNNSSVAVGSSETITITTNSVGIVTFTRDNISIGSTTTFSDSSFISNNQVSIASTITFNNSGIVKQIFENVTLVNTALSGTINVDILSGSLIYYTSNASANWIFNIRGNSNISLNSILPDGKSATVTMLCTQGVTAYYPSDFRIDNNPITPKWIEGSVPSSGFANSINVYTYAIFKTSDAAFTVLASQSRFS